MQVVTNENFSELMQNGKVAEFKPPSDTPEPAKAESANQANENKAPEPATPARDEKGRFTSQSTSDTKEIAGAKPEDEESDLPEKVRRIIGKKHREMKEAEEWGREQYGFRTAAEKRADAAEKQLREFEAKSRPAQSKEDSPPKPEDFATVAEYTDALTDYKVAKKFEAEKARQAKERQDAEQAERTRQFQARVSEVKKEFADFDSVMDGIAGTELDNVPKDVEEYLGESEYGPRLMYHLAKNPETLERLRKLSPRRFIAELGKLESKWEKKEESPPVIPATTSAVSKAPAPIAPLEGKSSTVEKDPAKMSFQELREFERQQRIAHSRR